MASETQGPFECLGSVIEKIAKKRGEASLPSSCADDPYSQAVAVVLRDRKVSTSYLQRRLGVSYNRAASLIERMETEGVISAANYMGKREVLVSVPKEHF